MWRRVAPPIDGGSYDTQDAPPHQESRMGRGDNRQTKKMKRRRSQSKLKARIKRKIDAAKAAKKPAAPSKKK
jgi:hypothetical protein